MAVEENRVSIVAWPEGQSAALRHSFDAEASCPVTVTFAPQPAHVVVSSSAQQPVHVDMAMQLTAQRPIPVCISLCEPICARSDYTVGIQIFGNPFASIDVRGTTRLGPCKEEPPTGVEVCLDFQRLKEGQSIPQPVVVDGVTFSPIGDPLRTITFGDPAGTVKLGFPPSGVRITFSGPVNDVRLSVLNYAGQTIDFAAFSGTTLLTRFSETIINSVKEVSIAQVGITSVEVSGGNHESGLVRVCYTAIQSAAPAPRG
jgi:hypothetical protein